MGTGPNTAVDGDAPVGPGRQPPLSEVNIESAQPATPPAIQLNALEPLVGAGVALTKIVLGMLTGVLLLLLGSLIYQETRFHDLITDAYRAAVGSIVSAPPVTPRSPKESGNDPLALDKLAEDIRALVPTTVGQPVDPHKLRQVLARANALSTSQLASSETLEQLKARQELLKAYMDATNATRDFWTRTAQMILLNLLLPVLTALLGYVFASKQSGK